MNIMRAGAKWVVWLTVVVMGLLILLEAFLAY